MSTAITFQDFRARLGNRGINVDVALEREGIRNNPGLKRIVERAAAAGVADRFIQGEAETRLLYGELARWYGQPPAGTPAGGNVLYVRTGGATQRAVDALVAASETTGTAGADAAEASLRDATRRHHDSARLTGLGTHYGNRSAFAALTLDEKRAYVASNAAPGTVPPAVESLRSSSCIEWVMEHVAAYYRAVNLPDRWRQIEETVRRENFSGMALARELQRDGWKAIYNNPDTRYSGGASGDTEHAYSHAVAHRDGTYYGVPVQGFLEDWHQDPSRLEPVRNAPFFIHVARGGYHVVAGTRGDINELARNEGPTETLIYQDPMEHIVDVYSGGQASRRENAMRMWGSGLTLFPPGTHS